VKMNSRAGAVRTIGLIALFRGPLIDGRQRRRLRDEIQVSHAGQDDHGDFRIVPMERTRDLGRD
jgi:hypothetical protein